MSASLLITTVAGLLDKLIPDKEKASEAKLKLIELEQAGQFKELDTIKEMALAHTEVSKVEAAHTNIFVSGGRPFLIWVGGLALAWQYILFPMVQTYLIATGNNVEIPEINNDVLFELVILLLGLGGYRTIERVQGKIK